MKYLPPSVFQRFFNRYSAFLTIILILSLLSSCASKKPISTFAKDKIPPPPQYSDLKNWASHPDKYDPADSIPKNTNFKNEQADSQIDIFFLHPTSYTMKRGNKDWNGDVNDIKLNKYTDFSSILYQASIFNAAGRIYAPRYRQAHIYSYFTSDKSSAQQAFEVAYEDIKKAFAYYLEHWNNGRPIIIASHSQGTTHAIRLLKDFFDEKTLKNRLVIAYLAGMPVLKNEFKSIPVCETPEQTGCFCSWRTFRKGYEPPFPMGDKIAVVNPISWKTTNEETPFSMHKGSVLVGFANGKANMLQAQIYKGILWVTKPKFKGSILYRTANYHVGDFNLFYHNIREDAQKRIGLFWKR